MSIDFWSDNVWDPPPQEEATDASATAQWDVDLPPDAFGFLENSEADPSPEVAIADLQALDWVPETPPSEALFGALDAIKPRAKELGWDESVPSRDLFAEEDEQFAETFGALDLTDAIPLDFNAAPPFPSLSPPPPSADSSDPLPGQGDDWGSAWSFENTTTLTPPKPKPKTKPIPFLPEPQSFSTHHRETFSADQFDPSYPASNFESAWEAAAAKAIDFSDVAHFDHDTLADVIQGLRDNDPLYAELRIAASCLSEPDDDGVPQLCASLLGNTVLSRLSISRNPVASADPFVALFEANPRLPLAQLHVDITDFPADHAARFIASLARCPALSVVSFLYSGSSSEALGPALFSLLSRSTSLSELRLHGFEPEVLVAAAPGIPLCRQLQHFELSFPSWLFNIMRARSAVMASIDASYEAQTALIDALKRAPALRSLTLGRLALPARFGFNLGKYLQDNTTLTALDLSGCSQPPNSGVAISKALRRNTTLRLLNLKGTNLEHRAGEHFAGSLAINAALTSLNLGRTSMGDSGAFLARSLPLLKSLTTVKLEAHELSQSCLPQIWEGLVKNTTITSFSLVRSHGYAIPASLFLRLFQQNSTLRALNLCQQQLELVPRPEEDEIPTFSADATPTEEFTDALAAAIGKNTSLTRLNLSQNRLGDFLEGIFKGLVQNSTLQSLDIAENEFTSIEYIVPVLKCNTTLTSLDMTPSLHHTYFSDLFIALDALARNDTVSSFTIHNVSPDFSSRLAINTTLKTLRMCSSHPGIVDAIEKKNQTLFSILYAHLLNQKFPTVHFNHFIDQALSL